MSESEPTKRRIGTGGELVLGALLGAILGWPITKALDTWSAENGWSWWVYVLGTVGGVAVVLLGMSLIIKRWRRAVWGGTARGLKWLWSWHPISARRLQATHAADFVEINKLFATDLPTLVRRIIADDDKTKAEIKDLLLPVFERRATAMMEAEMAKSSTQDIPKQPIPSPPRPDPRWSVQMDEDTYADFHLFNVVPRSIAREVRIEGDVDCTITSAGAWEDLSGESSGAFTARLSGEAIDAGVQFTIYWYDAAGALRNGKYFLSGDEIRRARAY